ncbi:MAG: GTPase HflX [Candidatus Fermentithermobacillus carboniphilus]|uniref:GTPase HflX n=1 Tax=Candidatus Fermentithermobacillus carboniphilus TaxID=3085328 RepID=A0AAT9LEN7_9FIRM|nr:MAG: GTPase HflX [Candidatus Fermentithermobacillus carboniphilus]
MTFLKQNPAAGQGEWVILAGIRSHDLAGRDDTFVLSPDESMQELSRLVETLGYKPCAVVFQERPAPDPATYLGKGKVQEIASLASLKGASLLVIDGQLSPSQSRNLEDATGISVMDRTEVILKIFAARARTREGKLQVELAAQKHALTRLAGRGKNMSNPGGGIGTRGPGEQKIDVDRRVIRQRIASLSREIQKVAKVRSEQKKKRRESKIPLVSLVGYTNAGKSTLFKALTGEEVLCDDKLFATLDPWTRRWVLPSGQVVLLTDTVGFIQGLPHELVAAFHATLEESLDAELLIHVVDLSSPTWMAETLTVERVLADLGAGQRPRITCFNKVDKVLDVDLEALVKRYQPAVAISALKGTGLDDLSRMVGEHILSGSETVSWEIPYSKWDVLYEIRRTGAVLEEKHGPYGATVKCRLPSEHAERFRQKLFGVQ